MGSATPPGREADVLLADGTTVHLRPIRPDDADAVVALHSRFSERTRYLRYFSAYPRIPEPIFAVPLILIEATGFALLNPALYSVVAANSPPGRSSTAQGLFGAAGTVGFIVASLIAGVLAKTNIVYPMYVFTAVLTITLIVGLIVGRGRLNGVGGRSRASYEPSRV